MFFTKFACRLIPHVGLFSIGSGMLINIVSLVLAVQNMEASCSVAKSQEIEFKALEGSLSMMSKGEFVPITCVVLYLIACALQS